MRLILCAALLSVCTSAALAARPQNAAASEPLRQAPGMGEVSSCDAKLSWTIDDYLELHRQGLMDATELGARPAQNKTKLSTQPRAIKTN